MTGIERLREFADGISPFTTVCGVTTTSYDREHTEVVGARLRDFLAAIVDQIERELREERSRWDDELCDAQMDKTCVMAVYLEMNRHVLGHEGMEDSPVASWARELRAALGGNGCDHAADVSVSAYDLLPQEDRDAIAWVREHGGLDAVKRRWECLSYYADPVPRSCMEKRLARLQRQIDESHAALQRRRETISELNRRACDLTRENAERGEIIRELSGRAAKQSDEIRVMRDVIAETCARLGVEGTGSTVDDAQGIWREISRRLMPDGMCWPVFEDGEPVRIGDVVADYVAGGEFKVRSIEFRDGAVYLRECYKTDRIIIVRPGERVKRPAPKVLDADGVEIRVGDTVYQMGCKYRISHLHGSNGQVRIVYENSGRWVDPKTLTHHAPVLAADGRPLREGEHVYHVETGTELVVKELPKPGEYQAVVVFALPTSPASHLTSFDPDRLTHERPVADTWERLEEDADRTASLFDAFDSDASADIRDLVRRAKKLAGVSE